MPHAVTFRLSGSIRATSSNRSTASSLVGSALWRPAFIRPTAFPQLAARAWRWSGPASHSQTTSAHVHRICHPGRGTVLPRAASRAREPRSVTCTDTRTCATREEREERDVTRGGAFSLASGETALHLSSPLDAAAAALAADAGGRTRRDGRGRVCAAAVPETQTHGAASALPRRCRRVRNNPGRRSLVSPWASP